MFLIWDTDVNGKQCAVQYSYKADHTPNKWIYHPKDMSGYDSYPVSNPDGDKWVFFRVCEAVSAFSCTSWKQYAT
ncbi:hypothetical protein DMB38_07770 [Streptomyces sp. WAC 06738]|nr:hypothetical protein DMB38_07770 [Streptomyces sp. WAC 06738]